MNKPVLSIVVPCYNEEEVLAETNNRLTIIIDDMLADDLISPKSSIIYVNDGSRDSTWQIIENLNTNERFVSGINLAKNVGHQYALMAGLMYAKDVSDITISIDADLQDDTQVIKAMVLEYLEGNDIVYGVRKSRKSDTFFKRNTALGFYKLMSSMGVNSVYNHADYRLMSHRALEQLSLFGESNLFLRCIVPLIGYKTSSVYYDRKERFAGESKYPFSKMFSFALDGITSFSVRPLRFICLVGVIFLFFTIIACIYSLISYLKGNAVPGWTSLFLSLWLIGSLMLISLGIIGEYIGKIYIEVKGRPRYNIERVAERKN